MTYQQLYGTLDSSLQLHKEANLESICDRATNLSVQSDYGIAGINYAGQLRLLRGKLTIANFKNEKSSSSLDIQGYCNCESLEHFAKNFPRPLNVAKLSQEIKSSIYTRRKLSM